MAVKMGNPMRQFETSLIPKFIWKMASSIRKTMRALENIFD
jgi:hypothetical protein